MRVTPLAAWLLPAAAFAVLAVAGCGSSKPNPTPADFGGLGSGSPGDPSSTRLGGEDSGTIFGVGKGANSDRAQRGGGGAGIGVNAFLWRGALDTIAFMPLASADPFGGVIITDWYTPPGTSGERFKATIYILSSRSAQRRRPGEHLPPGAAGRAMGRCDRGRFDGWRYREQSAGPRPSHARTVAGQQLNRELAGC